ncbi:hypothetical protein ACQ86F_36970 [Streptomyces venezuelae ATCC 10712]
MIVGVGAAAAAERFGKAGDVPFVVRARLPADEVPDGPGVVPVSGAGFGQGGRRAGDRHCAEQLAGHVLVGRVAEVTAAAGSVPVEHAQRPFHRVGLVYSVAAARRTDLDTGITCASALKPICRTNRTKTLVFDGEDVPEVREMETGEAEGDDVGQTVSVMGGLDWERWNDHLAAQGLLAEGFATAALSCIGSPLTAAIYRQGTIGAAKAHLEATARSLNDQLDKAVGGPGRALRQRRRRHPALHRGPRHHPAHRPAARCPGGGSRPAGPSARLFVGPAYWRRPARPG